MLLEVRQPGEGLVAELALVGGVLGGAQREAELPLGGGAGWGSGGAGGAAGPALRGGRTPGASGGRQRLWKTKHHVSF